MTKQTTIHLKENGPRHSLQIEDSTEQQVSELIAWGFGKNLTEIVRHAIRETWQTQLYLQKRMNPLERKARQSNKWIVLDARRNPRQNKEYEFDTEREAKSHIRQRGWHQVIYGPNGEFFMWDGLKWQHEQY